MGEIIALLSGLSQSRLRREPGAPEAELQEVESVNGIALPDDLRDALRFSNGFGIRSKGTSMSIAGAEELTFHSKEPHIEEQLPGMFVLGSDGEGSLFFADPHNELGRGPFAVYLVPMSDMGIDASRFLGASFTEAVELIVREEDLYERPTVSAERTYPKDLVALLEGSARITRSKPAATTEIDRFEDDELFELPNDLRAALGVSNGFTLRSEPVSLLLYSMERMSSTTAEERFLAALPGMLILGTDGHRGVFFADMYGQLGRGRFAIFLLPSSELRADGARFVATTFADAVKALLDGTDVYARPPLREGA